MKKTRTVKYAICDFCEGEVNCSRIAQPSGKDVCETHYNSFMEEIRLPDEFGNEMSGKRIAVDPGFEAKMVIEYKKEKK